jgi:phage terminase large subunit-like protein
LNRGRRTGQLGIWFASILAHRIATHLDAMGVMNKPVKDAVVNPEGGKISRAAAASPQLESGNWYLPHPLLKQWVDAFIAECAAFPAGANDDQVDAWSQGAKRLLHFRAESVPRSSISPRPYGGLYSWMG